MMRIATAVPHLYRMKAMMIAGRQAMIKPTWPLSLLQPRETLLRSQQRVVYQMGWHQAELLF